MNIALAALQGAGWLLARLGLLALILLGVVLALALLALLVPLHADIAWEGEEDGPGRLQVWAGALGLRIPVFTWPAPPPPPPGQEKKPGLWGRLKARWAARRAARRAKKAAARAARPAAPRPREKARLTLETLCAMLRGAGMLTRAVFGALRVTRIRLFWPVGGDEPAEAAVAYGKTNAWLYPLLGALSHFLYLDFEELRVVPCIDPEQPVPPARASCRVSARALFIVIAAVRVLALFYKEKVLDVLI